MTPDALPFCGDPSADPDNLYSAAAVRARCGLVFAAAERGETPHFSLHADRLDEAAERVAAVTRRRFPDLAVPYHSRWRHFAAGGIDRVALVAPDASSEEKARARIDLAIVSVLLDAGAGPKWRYAEDETGLVLSRSEGLAVASLRAMQAGLFSAHPADPWRADAASLAAITSEQLAAAFRHRPGNELTGLDGRAALLRRLGAAMAANPAVFGRPARLGNLLDRFGSAGVPPTQRGQDARAPGTVAAPDVLALLLRVMAPIWPPRSDAQGGLPPGDVGRHRAVPGDRLVPFHKLSQWLTYSLVEPLTDAGMTVTELDGLTGLPEYRNGGLLLDCRVLQPRDPDLAAHALDPLDEAVVEWRALTVVLLDRLAVTVRRRLGVTAAQFPLAKMLEGGTWQAGRDIAAEKRPGGRPPLTVASDGTIF